MPEPARYQVVPRVLCLLQHGERWLLIKRAPDRRLWPNYYNGLGGHVEEGEGILAAAQRELWEEAGIEGHDLRLRGIIHADEGGRGVIVFVLTGTAATTEVRASAEGTPIWVTAEEGLALNVLPDLRLTLPRILTMRPQDPPFLAHSTLDERGTPVLTFEEARTATGT